jgi:hypothetical protein
MPPTRLDLRELRETVARLLPSDHPVRRSIEAAPHAVTSETYDALAKMWLTLLYEDLHHPRKEAPP